jgi:hypothetical protein
VKLWEVTWLAASVTGAGPLVYRLKIQARGPAAAERAVQDLLGPGLFIVRTRRLRRWPWADWWAGVRDC